MRIVALVIILVLGRITVAASFALKMIDPLILTDLSSRPRDAPSQETHLSNAVTKQLSKSPDRPHTGFSSAPTEIYKTPSVIVQGRLVEKQAGSNEQILIVDDGGSMVEGTLASSDTESFAHLQEGSKIQIRGLPSVAIDKKGELKALRVSLPSARDAEVVKVSDSWPVTALWAIIRIYTFALLAVVGWLIILKRRVAEQIGVISQQLKEADRLREKAEAASRTKSDFLANMSHEIRTPLNGVIGMTELAMSSSGMEQHEYHTLIKSSGEALLVILNDILDYSKIEAGKVTLESVDFSLEEVIGSCIKSIAPSAHKKGLELTYYLEPDVPLNVSGDPSRLRQALMNLAGNALKFTAEGEVDVRVSVDKIVGPKVQVHFSVRDTGIGIPKEKQRRLFQPFEQADSSTTRRYGGTGLGLAISARIAQLLGGAIWIESTQGLGSTFHFTAAFGRSPSLETLGRRTASNLSFISLLVIDNNATSRKIVEEITSSWQMETVSAESASAGIRVLEQAAANGKPFRLVLFDDPMPGMNGADFIERVRSGPAVGTSMIMMLSSASSADSVQDSTTYLTKPFGYNDLRAAVERGLAGANRGQAISASPVFSEPARALHFLVAEDNPVNQKLAAAMFKKMGHSITLAHNGLEAVMEWNRMPFDLIFMDVQMPEMDGLEAARQIRRQELAKGTRACIIAMTANVLDGDRDLCLSAGMDDYISKPIRHSALLDVIRRATSRVC